MPAKKKLIPHSKIGASLNEAMTAQIVVPTPMANARRLLINELHTMSERELATRLIRDAGVILQDRLLPGVQDYDDEKSPFRFDESRTAERQLCIIIENLVAARTLILSCRR